MSDFCSALYLSAFSTFATIQAVEAFDLTWADVEYFKAGAVMVHSSQHVSAPIKAMMSSIFIGSGLFFKRYDMWEDETNVRYGNAALVGLTVFDALWLRPVLTDALISALKH
jgi:hypothetical protein